MLFRDLNKRAAFQSWLQANHREFYDRYARALLVGKSALDAMQPERDRLFRDFETTLLPARRVVIS
jgi:hypothetical protein